MGQAYSALAEHYDSLMTDFDYYKYYEFVKCYATGTVLELACGSGTFTALLLKSSDNVLAVDCSREMLNVAESRNFRDRQYVKFIEASMLDFECMRKVDNAFCVCDGVNYIAPSELTSLAVRVNQNLKKGGHFVFDISSEYKLREVIGNNIFYEDTDDMTYLWTNKLNENSVDMELIVFDRKGDSYTRRDEEHTQYIHNKDSVISIFENNGFAVKVYCGESFGEVKECSKRLLFICEKREEV